MTPGFYGLLLRHSSKRVGAGPFPGRAAENRGVPPNLRRTVPRVRFKTGLTKLDFTTQERPVLRARVFTLLNSHVSDHAESRYDFKKVKEKGNEGT